VVASHDAGRPWFASQAVSRGALRACGVCGCGDQSSTGAAWETQLTAGWAAVGVLLGVVVGQHAQGHHDLLLDQRLVRRVGGSALIK
jgi:uncharacterized ferredoxin-like protein